MKVLEYFKESHLGPVGGPAGYLHNLKVQRDSYNDSDIDFINQTNTSTTLISTTIMYILRIYWKVKYRNVRVRFLKKAIYLSKRHGNIDFSKYSIIHFHSTLEMFMERKALEHYEGIVLLTTHSPRVFFKENIEDYLDINTYLEDKNFFDELEDVDIFSFQRADYIIFPCMESEEPYYNSWNRYESIRIGNKIKYVPTGILEQRFKLSTNKVRNKLGIPNDSFVISFVGRHNVIKGYDLLIELFNKIDDIYVICCGNMGSIKPPVNSHWIEVGWTNDPYSYVNASDLFILPNRDTYFDLCLLQTMSIGKVALISKTGGNKFFKNRENMGIFMFSNLSEAIDRIQEIRTLSREEKRMMEKSMREYFHREFSNEVFYKRYKELLNNIAENRTV